MTYNDLHDRAVDLLRQYGDAASYHAASKADEAFARGDSDTQRIWISVLKLVEQIDRIGEASLVQ